MHHRRATDRPASIDEALEELNAVIESLLDDAGQGSVETVRAIPWDALGEEDAGRGGLDRSPGRSAAARRRPPEVDPVHVRIAHPPWEDETFCLTQRREGGGRVDLFASPASAARAFWRAALRQGVAVRYDARDGAAVVGGMVVLFRDGRWDTLGAYRPCPDEERFWAEVAGCYAELPGWTLR